MWNFPSAEQVLSVMRAAHDRKPTVELWLSGLVEAMAANFNQGAGVEGVLYDLSASPQIKVESIFASGVPVTWKAAGLEMHQCAPFSELLTEIYRSQRSGTLAELTSDADAFAPMRSMLYEKHAVASQILVNGSDNSGKGCCFHLLSRFPLSISEQLRWLLNELGAEFAKAYRTRRLLDERVRARESGARSPAALSEREHEVVSLAARGLSNKVIASELGVAFSTVRVLMARACSKLGVASRSDLVSQGGAHYYDRCGGRRSVSVRGDAVKRR
ncbi:MAG: LuxR family transcriptional regulator [Myxococcales bacterium]|nr:MAG: LuxR family transcriptional regulator [Myxococcales bacterium]